MMAEPCAVFWDIENIDVPKGQSVASIVNLIRSTIIKPQNLNEIFFFCVCDVQKLPSNVGHSLTNLDVSIVQAYNGIKDSADMQIMDLMRKFVKFAGQDCSIILLSGDADYYGTLSDLKKLHNVSIHLIRLANSWSPKLDQISDYTFVLANGVLKPVKSSKYFSVEWKIFFRIDYSFVSLILLFCQRSKWSLLYNLFEQIHDLGAKKVIFDGNLYCAQFDSDSAYQDAFEKLSSRYLKPLELVNEPDTRKIEKKMDVQKKMDRYITGIPYCLNQELDLCCFVVKIEYKLTVWFLAMSKSILEDHECIFIKSVPGKIWLGFPGESACNNSKETVRKLFGNPPETYIIMAKPSNELLESINLEDLVGDAHNLASLAKQ